MQRIHFGIAATILPLLALGSTTLDAAPPVDFVRDVRPILQKHCFDCHAGEDAESGLRLDLARGALEGGNSGPAVVPGKPDGSLLVRKVSAENADDRMPPSDSGPALSAAEVAVIRTWVKEGAPLPVGQGDEAPTRKRSDHWSFQPLVRPDPPSVANGQWPRNPIDPFILQELEQKKLSPAAEADRVTLVRRLSLDLLGLPPSPQEVDAFVLDNRADALDRLVDRLLASPHYGERWARHWLDQARYADSDGYTNDVPRTIWPWRDWVIAALNANQPFDQFVIDQIAGDLRPQATDQQIVATGFHRNTQHNREGGSDPEQYRVERIADRVSTTGEVILGLTIGCARCHDHKFDPISQREFFQLYAFFDDCQEAEHRVLSPRELEKRQSIQAEIAALQRRMQQATEDHAAAQSDWEQRLLRSQPKWTVLDAAKFVSESGATIAKQDDGSLFVSGAIPIADSYRVEAAVPLDRVTAVRLEVLTDDRLPRRGPGLKPDGNFILSELQLKWLNDEPGKLQPAPIAAAVADHAQDGFPVEHAIDGREDTGWAIDAEPADGGLNQDRVAIFFLKDNAPAGNKQLRSQLVQQFKGAGSFQIGRFRLSVTDAPREAIDFVAAESLLSAMRAPDANRTEAQRNAVKSIYLRTVPELTALTKQLDDLHNAENRLVKRAPKTLVLEAPRQPRKTHVHLRGDFRSPGRVVRAGTPAVLPALHKSQALPTRMDLAKWLVSAENPLTARVTVNRLWQAYFGRGLVETDNDFGTQGSRPSHPRLLDWLAGELVASGWDLKHMHRLIVTSATYRQSSVVRREVDAADPRNVLLARQSRLRLEAEIVRDSALAAGGLLSTKIGGPSVFPPQPEGVMNLTLAADRKWEVSSGEDRYRRGLYTYFWRNAPHPFLKAFDAPDSNTACTRRARTNTPLQALMLLNDEAFVEAAEGLAARVLSQEHRTDDPSRLTAAFELCVAHKPSPRELSRLGSLLDQERARLADDVELPSAPAASRFPAQASAKERAAWTSVARAMLNVNEFMTRE